LKANFPLQGYTEIHENTYQNTTQSQPMQNSHDVIDGIHQDILTVVRV
jgi:hypothetical protein